jgi:hypothetical protein
MTSSPLELWLRYMWRLPETIIVFSQGFIGSVTQACRGNISMGVFIPTILVIEGV